jgi:hypothetical protein
MMREALQDFEARLTIIEVLAKLPAEQQTTYRTLLDDFRQRCRTGNEILSQMELNLNWPGYVARLYRAAEELTGVKTEAHWDNPPR